MLNLITAVPGSGKTLYVLKTVSDQAKRDNRQVYYSGIPLTDAGKAELEWIELEDPEKWFELPAGAIIIIDECQRIFPLRRNGTEVPKKVSMFETHRHHGFDVWLITQSPMLLDNHVRQIVNKHIHLKRIFGTGAAQALKFDSIENAPNSVSASARCLDKEKFIYPKEVYRWYTSAQLHTHKVQIPKAAKMAMIAIAVVAAGLYFSMKSIGNLSNTNKEMMAFPSGTASAPAGSAPLQAVRVDLDLSTPEAVASAHAAVVPDRPETAPIYAELAVPTTFPQLTGCIQSETKCSCYSQQGTIIKDVPANVCADVVQNGRFNPYEVRSPADYRSVQDSSVAQQGQGSNKLSSDLLAQGDISIGTQGKPDMLKTPAANLM